MTDTASNRVSSVILDSEPEPWMEIIGPITVAVSVDAGIHHISWRAGRIVLESHDGADDAFTALGGEACHCYAIAEAFTAPSATRWQWWHIQMPAELAARQSRAHASAWLLDQSVRAWLVANGVGQRRRDDIVIRTQADQRQGTKGAFGDTMISNQPRVGLALGWVPDGIARGVALVADDWIEAVYAPGRAVVENRLNLGTNGGVGEDGEEIFAAVEIRDGAYYAYGVIGHDGPLVLDPIEEVPEDPELTGGQSVVVCSHVTWDYDDNYYWPSDGEQAVMAVRDVRSAQVWMHATNCREMLVNAERLWEYGQSLEDFAWYQDHHIDLDTTTMSEVWALLARTRTLPLDVCPSFAAFRTIPVFEEAPDGLGM